MIESLLVKSLNKITQNMKKNILIVTLFVFQSIFSQNTFPTSGNVGIGTTNPVGKLDVIGSAKFRESNGSYYSELSSDTNNAYLRSYGVANSLLIYDILGKPLVMQPYSGNVGIGTFNPDEKLVVNGNAKVKENLFITGASGGYTTGDNPILYFGTVSEFAKINVPFADKMIFSSYHGYTFNTSYNGSLVLPALTISIMGNVGIGTTNPTSKLTVAGNIHAQEVKVTINAGVVPDYVFANDYKLKSLQEVEDYIKQNSHLPEIPSATEIEKNGLMLAEMNLNLLKKMEEMTLYMIEQNKQIIDLKNRLEKVESISLK